MNLATAATLDWRVLGVIVLILVALIFGFVFLLRQNRSDLAGLRETLRQDNEDGDAGDGGP